MTTAFELAVQLADQIDQFPLGECGPSDDPDKQYAYCAAFRDTAKRFVAAVKRIGDPDLSLLVSELNTSPSYISEAHDLRADLYVAIDALREAARDPNYSAIAATNGAFLSPEVLLRLKAIPATNLDPAKLVRICEELNDAYARANFISAALLIRACINHVPTVFGVDTFSQVVAQSGRSIKAILTRLNDDARPIADLHTHLVMRRSEYLPTKNQLEPYKAAFEVLIQEVIATLVEA
ncbi:hypothetical protein [Xanthomonas hortorum]|uniref:Abortive infection protein-like C-terminal domain-containing protein n=3 Tax=Xanthomonas hortorum TaxID=56454 RepID=A0A6V7BBE4_9XANT|nr:hypothetical protein [Xanthomonas hortorum]MCE4355523.1 hypothetical protein [Xanthomonas hortorum pv. pelargonii]MCM5524519.1 hypothetical protein [Xanthomonas hortorum pv. pelargonii]MCM5537062.1 hypothetical protein [Xanthomonas hortorum pv. pelargonii]MCM5540647.1 hypothetical protein [Xanthomonas hortorum pv. pelargonii]MCM5545125.1 hypothetical protein [Xanthomonas hortorum pv. pelargonii]